MAGLNIEYRFIAASFKIGNHSCDTPPGLRAEMREEFLLNHYRKSVQNYMRFQDMCG